MWRIILFAVLAVLVVRAFMRLGRGILQGAGYSRTGPNRPSVPLVKDPVCGIFIPRTKALTAGSGDETKYFCSDTCRQEWKRR